MAAVGLRAATSIEVQPSVSGPIGFTLLPPQSTGITFSNTLAEDRHLTNQILLNGSGLAAGDVDGDGRVDLYFCALDGPNVLYRNLGNWKFQDMTATAGVACPDTDATGTAFADLDGDGDLDLVVNTVGQGTRIFLNDGRGRFQEDPRNAGLNGRLGGTSLALGDIDGDGDLDLYVANYRTVTIRDQPNTRFTFRIVDGKPQVASVDGRPLTEPDLANRFNFRITLGEGTGRFIYEENGEPDALLLNDGTGRFAPVAFTNGAFLDAEGKALTAPLFDWGLTVLMRDLNGDGAPDLYVCNDFNSPDRLWLNNGKGQFRAPAPLALRHQCLSSMGLDVADINRDGFDDIFALDMLSRQHEYRFSQRIDLRPEVLPFGVIDNRPQYSRNMLFLNRGDGTYAEIAQFAGLEAAEWAWMPVFLDVDLDGYEDVLIPNGFERDNMNIDALRQIETLKKSQKLTSLEQLRLRKLFPRLDTANLAFHNLGNLRFQEMGAAWGFNARGVTQGTVLADLDNDGDLDVVVNNMNGVAGIYRNNCPAARLAVRLKGRPPNTRGIGAKIRVLGGPVPQSQEIMAGGRYLSSDDPMRVFACGTNGSLTLEVTWRSGRRSVVTDARPNRIYTIEESSAIDAPRMQPALPKPLFEDVSNLITHTHADADFDEFARQPLLPRRLGHLGPGVAWSDVDGDGWEDLIIGSGPGGRLAAYRNNGQGGFRPMDGFKALPVVERDQGAIVSWRQTNGPAAILAVVSNYRDGAPGGVGVQRYEVSGQSARVTALLPAAETSFGPMVLGDVDGDGDLDLFVGGRTIPGKYGEPATSLLFLAGPDGKLTPDDANNRWFAKLGMVSGAVFSDLNGDGFPELVLACDWGPVRVFRNERGKFSEATESLGLSQHSGWWNGVATGDFDGDGQLDIVASNCGRNTHYEHFRGEALYLFVGDLEGNGTVETIEAYLNPERRALAPLQPIHQVRQALPWLAEQVGSCNRYSRSTLAELYGEPLKQCRQLKAHWLETTVFLNRSNRFEARALPEEAQFAPAFGVCVADLDGDGCEDVVLSQNFSGWPADYPRSDAGLGLWLRGDGHGAFKAVPVTESGIRIYGDQRGAALADFDHDGRVDLVIGQNAQATRLLRNQQARPGLRVRLLGRPGNPDAVGATLRLMNGATAGPCREIHGGGGFGSQDSPVPVLSLPEPLTPQKLWVRWPGGQVTITELPGGLREVAVDATGRLVSSR